jgi:lysozyme
MAIGMLSPEANRAIENAMVHRFPERPVETNLSQFIKNFEGYRDSGYYATEGEKKQGLVTVGYGSTGRVKHGEKITQQQAEQFLREDIEEAERKVNSLVTVPLTDNMRSALVSLLFNTRYDSVRDSKALTALNKGDFKEFQKQAFGSNLGFVYGGGKKLKGLSKRRTAEKYLFREGMFKYTNF